MARLPLLRHPALNPVLRAVPNLESLPAPLLEAGARASFFAGLPWWQTMLEAGLPKGAEPRLLLWESSALFPMQRLASGRLESLANPYTCLYQPLLMPNLPPETIQKIGQALGRYCREWPTVRLDALPRDSAWLPPLLAGLRAAGLVAAPFDHFGNRYEPVAGQSWETYLQSRPGSLRETIRRKLRRVTHEIITTPDALEAGITTYEDIYARSWKVPEPYPAFNATMMRHAATAGLLRLGLLRAGETPIAAQIWIVANRQAAVLKLAHDETHKPLSPGTLLTALMIRDLLDTEHVAELDFGRGDDPYKELWTTQRRQRIGLMLINPRRPAGLAALARHLLGRTRRRLAA